MTEIDAEDSELSDAYAADKAGAADNASIINNRKGTFTDMKMFYSILAIIACYNIIIYFYLFYHHVGA